MTTRSTPSCARAAAAIASASDHSSTPATTALRGQQAPSSFAAATPLTELTTPARTLTMNTATTTPATERKVARG